MGGVLAAITSILSDIMPPTNRGGRPRKPDRLKRLHGTDRKDRKRNSIVVKRKMPRRPVGLSSQAVRIWNSLGPQIHELGLLNEIDSSAFGVFCQAYGDWLELTRHLNRLGVLNWYQVTDSGYRQVIPEVGARNTALQTMNKFGSKFGLDPSSRSGFNIEENKLTETEEFLFPTKVIA